MALKTAIGLAMYEPLTRLAYLVPQTFSVASPKASMPRYVKTGNSLLPNCFNFCSSDKR